MGHPSRTLDDSLSTAVIQWVNIRRQACDESVRKWVQHKPISLLYWSAVLTSNDRYGSSWAQVCVLCNVGTNHKSGSTIRNTCRRFKCIPYIFNFYFLNLIACRYTSICKIMWRVISFNQLNRSQVILIDKIMYFAIFCTCHVISPWNVSQTCLTVCIHARTLPTVILNCHSQRDTFANSSRTTHIWLLFTVACSIQS